MGKRIYIEQKMEINEQITKAPANSRNAIMR